MLKLVGNNCVRESADDGQSERELEKKKKKKKKKKMTPTERKGVG
jgi:uncharacterized protein YheU (UPF0270 family)